MPSKRVDIFADGDFFDFSNDEESHASATAITTVTTTLSTIPANANEGNDNHPTTTALPAPPIRTTDTSAPTFLKDVDTIPEGDTATKAADATPEGGEAAAAGAAATRTVTTSNNLLYGRLTNNLGYRGNLMKINSSSSEDEAPQHTDGNDMNDNNDNNNNNNNSSNNNNNNHFITSSANAYSSHEDHSAEQTDIIGVPNDGMGENSPVAPLAEKREDEDKSEKEEEKATVDTRKDEEEVAPVQHRHGWLYAAAVPQQAQTPEKSRTPSHFSASSTSRSSNHSSSSSSSKSSRCASSSSRPHSSPAETTLAATTLTTTDANTPEAQAPSTLPTVGEETAVAEATELGFLPTKRFGVREEEELGRHTIEVSTITTRVIHKGGEGAAKKSEMHTPSTHNAHSHNKHALVLLDEEETTAYDAILEKLRARKSTLTPVEQVETLPPYIQYDPTKAHAPPPPAEDDDAEEFLETTELTPRSCVSDRESVFNPHETAAEEEVAEKAEQVPTVPSPAAAEIIVAPVPNREENEKEQEEVPVEEVVEEEDGAAVDPEEEQHIKDALDKIVSTPLPALPPMPETQQPSPPQAEEKKNEKDEDEDEESFPPPTEVTVENASNEQPPAVAQEEEDDEEEEDVSKYEVSALSGISADSHSGTRSPRPPLAPSTQRSPPRAPREESAPGSGSATLRRANSPGLKTSPRAAKRLVMMRRKSAGLEEDLKKKKKKPTPPATKVKGGSAAPPTAKREESPLLQKEMTAAEAPLPRPNAAKPTTAATPKASHQDSPHDSLNAVRDALYPIILDDANPVNHTPASGGNLVNTFNSSHESINFGEAAVRGAERLLDAIDATAFDEPYQRDSVLDDNGYAQVHNPYLSSSSSSSSDSDEGEHPNAAAGHSYHPRKGASLQGTTTEAAAGMTSRSTASRYPDYENLILQGSSARAEGSSSVDAKGNQQKEGTAGANDLARLWKALKGACEAVFTVLSKIVAVERFQEALTGEPSSAHDTSRNVESGAAAASASAPPLNTLFDIVPLIQVLKAREMHLSVLATNYVKHLNLCALRLINQRQYSLALQLLIRADAVVQPGEGIVCACADIFDCLRREIMGSTTQSGNGHREATGAAAAGASPLFSSSDFFRCDEMDAATEKRCTEALATMPPTPMEVKVPFFAPQLDLSRQRAAAITQNNLGLYHFKLGEFQLAVKQLQAALVLEEALEVREKESSSYPRTAEERSTIHITFFNYAQALREVQQSGKASLHDLDAATSSHVSAAAARASGRKRNANCYTYLRLAEDRTEGVVHRYKEMVKARRHDVRMALDKHATTSRDEKELILCWLHWRQEVCLLAYMKEKHGDWLCDVTHSSNKDAGGGTGDFLAEPYSEAAYYYEQSIRWLSSIPNLDAAEQQKLKATRAKLRRVQKRLQGWAHKRGESPRSAPRPGSRPTTGNLRSRMAEGTPRAAPGVGTGATHGLLPSGSTGRRNRPGSAPNVMTSGPQLCTDLSPYTTTTSTWHAAAVAATSAKATPRLQRPHSGQHASTAEGRPRTMVVTTLLPRHVQVVDEALVQAIPLRKGKKGVAATEEAEEGGGSRLSPRPRKKRSTPQKKRKKSQRRQKGQKPSGIVPGQEFTFLHHGRRFSLERPTSPPQQSQLRQQQLSPSPKPAPHPTSAVRVEYEVDFGGRPYAGQRLDTALHFQHSPAQTEHEAPTRVRIPTKPLGAEQEKSHSTHATHAANSPYAQQGLHSSSTPHAARGNPTVYTSPRQGLPASASPLHIHTSLRNQPQSQQQEQQHTAAPRTPERLPPEAPKGHLPPSVASNPCQACYVPATTPASPPKQSSSSSSSSSCVGIQSSSSSSGSFDQPHLVASHTRTPERDGSADTPHLQHSKKRDARHHTAAPPPPPAREEVQVLQDIRSLVKSVLEEELHELVRQSRSRDRESEHEATPEAEKTSPSSVPTSAKHVHTTSTEESRGAASRGSESHSPCPELNSLVPASERQKKLEAEEEKGEEHETPDSSSSASVSSSPPSSPGPLRCQSQPMAAASEETKEERLTSASTSPKKSSAREDTTTTTTDMFQETQPSKCDEDAEAHRAASVVTKTTEAPLPLSVLYDVLPPAGHATMLAETESLNNNKPANQPKDEAAGEASAKSSPNVTSIKASPEVPVAQVAPPKKVDSETQCGEAEVGALESMPVVKSLPQEQQDGNAASASTASHMHHNNTTVNSSSGNTAHKRFVHFYIPTPPPSCDNSTGPLTLPQRLHPYMISGSGGGSDDAQGRSESVGSNNSEPRTYANVVLNRGRQFRWATTAEGMPPMAPVSPGGEGAPPPKRTQEPAPSEDDRNEAGNREEVPPPACTDGENNTPRSSEKMECAADTVNLVTLSKKSGGLDLLPVPTNYLQNVVGKRHDRVQVEDAVGNSTGRVHHSFSHTQKYDPLLASDAQGPPSSDPSKVLGMPSDTRSAVISSYPFSVISSVPAVSGLGSSLSGSKIKNGSDKYCFAVEIPAVNTSADVPSRTSPNSPSLRMFPLGVPGFEYNNRHHRHNNHPNSPLAPATGPTPLQATMLPPTYDDVRTPTVATQPNNSMQRSEDAQTTHTTTSGTSDRTQFAVNTTALPTQTYGVLTPSTSGNGATSVAPSSQKTAHLLSHSTTSTRTYVDTAVMRRQSSSDGSNSYPLLKQTARPAPEQLAPNDVSYRQFIQARIIEQEAALLIQEAWHTHVHRKTKQ